MTTLKEHQAAMVDLLANGSAIPASASRLAHAMHDVLKLLLADKSALQDRLFVAQVSEQAQNKVYGALSDAVTASFMDATTPGLNEKALSKPVTATKTDSHSTRPAPAEIRVKELQNTIKQLKEHNAKLKGQLALVREQRDDELHRNTELDHTNAAQAAKIRALVSGESVQEQAGVRKEDTEIDETHAKHRGNQCDHLLTNDYGRGLATCVHCGALF